jgi:hypothetical protein
MPSVANVSYTSVRNAGNAVFTLPTIYTTPRKRGEAQLSYGVYKRWTTTFKIDPAVWTAAAGANVYPKFRDTLAVDGITWTVRRDVDSPAPRGLWRLSCTYLFIDPELADTISVKPPVDATDGDSSPLTTVGDNSAWDGLTARIQFDRELPVNYQGVAYMRSLYTVWVSGLNSELPLGTVITCSAGKYAGKIFRVLECENIDTLEELQKISVTVDP